MTKKELQEENQKQKEILDILKPYCYVDRGTHYYCFGVDGGFEESIS